MALGRLRSSDVPVWGEKNKTGIWPRRSGIAARKPHLELSHPETLLQDAARPFPSPPLLREDEGDERRQDERQRVARPPVLRTLLPRVGSHRRRERLRRRQLRRRSRRRSVCRVDAQAVNGEAKGPLAEVGHGTLRSKPGHDQTQSVHLLRIAKRRLLTLSPRRLKNEIKWVHPEGAQLCRAAHDSCFAPGTRALITRDSTRPRHPPFP